MQTIEELEQQRSKLYQDLSGSGDLRRGSVGVTYRRCGRPNCACADPDHPGHGPRLRLTRSVDGKTEAKQLHPGPELEKVTREVANYRRFVAISEQIVEVNERICEARPVAALAADQPPAEAEGKKKGSSRSSRRTSPPR